MYIYIYICVYIYKDTPTRDQLKYKSMNVLLLH